MTKEDKTITILEKLDKLETKVLAATSTLNTSYPIENYTVDKTLISQIELQMTWNKFLGTVSWLLKQAKDEEDVLYAIAFRDAKLHSNVSLSASELKFFAESDMDYQDMKQVTTAVMRLKYTIQANVDAIESRKYILKDLVSLLIAGSEKYII